MQGDQFAINVSIFFGPATAYVQASAVKGRPRDVWTNGCISAPGPIFLHHQNKLSIRREMLGSSRGILWAALVGIYHL